MKNIRKIFIDGEWEDDYENKDEIEWENSPKNSKIWDENIENNLEDIFKYYREESKKRKNIWDCFFCDYSNPATIVACLYLLILHIILLFTLANPEQNNSANTEYKTVATITKIDDTSLYVWYWIDGTYPREGKLPHTIASRDLRVGNRVIVRYDPKDFDRIYWETVGKNRSFTFSPAMLVPIFFILICVTWLSLTFVAYLRDRKYQKELFGTTSRKTNNPCWDCAYCGTPNEEFTLYCVKCRKHK
jgi:hypothetical protein